MLGLKIEPNSLHLHDAMNTKRDNLLHAENVQAYAICEQLISGHTCNSTEEGRSGSTQQLLHRLSEPGLALDALDPPCADLDVLKALL